MSENKSLRFIRCWAGAGEYGLEMDWVRSIQRIDNLQRTVGEGGEIGRLDMAGTSVPVWSLAERLNESAGKARESQRVIVMNDPIRPWGMLVDRVSQVTAVSQEQLFPMPMIAVNPARPYFSGVIRFGDALLLRLDPDCLHPDAAWPIHSSTEDLLPAPVPSIVDVQNGNGRSGQIVLFKLPGRSQEEQEFSFALSITQVAEALEPLPTIPIPGASDFVMGLANWRNRPVPVIDLGCRLGLMGVAGGYGSSRLMITRTTTGDELVGFLVRPSIRILRLPLNHQPNSHALPFDQRLIRGSFELEGDGVIIPAV